MTTTPKRLTAAKATTEQDEYAARVAEQIAAHRAKQTDEEREIEEFYLRVYE